MKYSSKISTTAGILLKDYLDTKLQGGKSVAETFLTGFPFPGLDELLLAMAHSVIDGKQDALDTLLDRETSIRLALYAFAYFRQGFEAYVDHRLEMGE